MARLAGLRGGRKSKERERMERKTNGREEGEKDRETERESRAKRT